MEVQGKKIVIVGAGKSGLAAARYCAQKGADVVINDARTRDELADIVLAFEELGAEIKLGGHTEEVFQGADNIILSPGIPPNLPALQTARTAGTPILGEIELASRLTLVPLVGVTGTNGKSTTASLLHEILLKGGRLSGLAGNIGLPFLELVTNQERRNIFVLEISSYQLETIETLHPKLAILLNISPDHLSRHPTLKDYATAKGRLFSNQEASDWVVYNANDPLVTEQAQKSAAQKMPFHLTQTFSPGICSQGDEIIYTPPAGPQEAYDLSQFSLAGDHNRENAMAAIAAARLTGVDQDSIRRTLDHFQGLPHRFEFLGDHQGVTYINDSKATNVGATVRSIAGMPQGHLILLAGGEDKGSSYKPLVQALIERKAKQICLYGEAAAKLAAAIGSELPTVITETLDDAFQVATQTARAGDSILLAPACASFDQFTDFVVRGNHFRDLFVKLGEAA